MLATILRSLIILTTFCSSHLLHKRDYENRRYFALKIRTNTENLASDLGNSLKLRFEGRVGNLPNHFLYSSLLIHLEKRDVSLETDIDKDPAIIWSQEQIPQKRLFKRDGYSWKELRARHNITDPGFENQWHLHNTEHPGNDINVTGVWDQGINGKGVLVSFVDDGLDYDHPDLKDHFTPIGNDSLIEALTILMIIPIFPPRN